MLVYAAVQLRQIETAIDVLQANGNITSNTIWGDLQPYLVAAPCIIGVATVAMSFVAWRLYEEFAWTIYKHISDYLRMKQRFLAFQLSY
jgi:hypothetical protein